MIIYYQIKERRKIACVVKKGYRFTRRISVRIFTAIAAFWLIWLKKNL